MMIRFLILLLLSNTALAGGFIGTSVSHLNINDGYKYGSNYQPSLVVGYNKVIGDYFVGVSTTRLNPSVEKSAKKGAVYQSKSKVEADTLSVGLKGRLIPSVFVSNVQVGKRLYYKNVKLGSTHKSSILCGFSLNYFLNKRISLGGAYVLPNREQSLESGFVASLNYNF